jgi:hypothetical protein
MDNLPKASCYFKSWFLVGDKEVLIWDLVEKTIKHRQVSLIGHQS